MKLKNLHTFQSLITEISDEVVDLANFLEIPVNVEKGDDHIFIEYYNKPLSLNTVYTRRDTDLLISAKEFCNILMDVKGGLTVLEAYQKQGYTFDF